MSTLHDRAIRVLIVDDHPIVRTGLRSLLTQPNRIEVVGEAADSMSAIEGADSLKPDVIIVDIKLDKEDGLKLARQLLRRDPERRIVLLTSYDADEYLVEAARIGVHGYLLKSASAELLAETIEAAHRGERRLSPSIGERAFDQVRDLIRERALASSGLSPEEIAILGLMADGASAFDIGDRLNYSERQVKRRIQDILTKLGAGNRTQAVAEAYERGLL